MCAGLLGSISLFSQGYDIQWHVAQAPAGTSVVLGTYEAGILTPLDSVRLDTVSRTAHFRGARVLPNGLYCVRIAQKASLDFVVNDEAALSFRTHYAAPTDSVRVVVSAENQGYWAWKADMATRQRTLAQRQSMLTLIQRATKDKTAIATELKNIRALEEEMVQASRAYAVEYPHRFFPKLIQATLPPRVPKGIPPYTGEQVNVAYVRYFKSHFWDAFDFRDERLLRSTALPERVDHWLTINAQPLDTAKAAVDALLRRTKPYPSMHRAVVRHLVQRFERPELANGDAMLVYLFDKHLPTARAAGTDTATWMRIEYKANAFRPLLNGLIAPDFRLPDATDTLRTLSALPARYTLLYFFSPLCKQCQEITPRLHALLQAYRAKGLQVVAVTTDCPKAYWQQYVKATLPGWTCLWDERRPSPLTQQYAISGLPNAYFLDAQRRIVAKRVPWEQVEAFLEQWIGR